MALAEKLNEVARGTLATARRWMLTINNPTFEESETLYALGHHKDVDCLVYGAEHCDEGTPHFQIYLHFKEPCRWARIKGLFPRADIEIAKKPKIACCRYCAKEGFYYAFGNVPDLTTGHRQGSQAQKRAAENLEREDVIKKIRKGEMRYKDLSEANLLDTKLLRAAKEAVSMCQPPKRYNVHVCVFISPTGWGKSFSVWEHFGIVAQAEFAGNNDWYLNAEEEVMLYDEFCGQVRVQKFLKYLDGYPMWLAVKGGHRPCYWKVIFICSNTPPEMWYTQEDKATGIRTSTIPEPVRQALYRRIGYPNSTTHGETHVYDPTFTDMPHARDEMNQICQRIHDQYFAVQEAAAEEPEPSSVEAIVHDSLADETHDTQVL